MVRKFNTKVAVVRREFDVTTKREREAYRKRIRDLVDTLKKRLQAVLAQRTRDGDLDGALEIRKQIKIFSQLSLDPPGGDPVSLASELRSLKQELEKLKVTKRVTPILTLPGIPNLMSKLRN